ncbi:MAG TPA: OB-fold domain-containing protein [Acidimicrobiia bacterium]|nr:OB-fold domain-containing protein [Acidimicrobiia bacterium]
MALKRADFPLPDLSDERTAEYFAGGARGELVIPRCDECAGLVWYPEPRCPACGCESFSWRPVSGRGRLFSWTVVRRPFLPAFQEMVPFITALVSLEEDPAVRIVSYVVDCEPEVLTAGMPVEVVFRALRFPTVPDRSVQVPMFVPA